MELKDKVGGIVFGLGLVVVNVVFGVLVDVVLVFLNFGFCLVEVSIVVVVVDEELGVGVSLDVLV